MNMEINEFLGHPVEYWIVLKEKADALDITDLILEIATLRAKVSFYESRINQMEIFRHRVNKPIDFSDLVPKESRQQYREDVRKNMKKTKHRQE